MEEYYTRWRGPDETPPDNGELILANWGGSFVGCTYDASTNMFQWGFFSIDREEVLGWLPIYPFNLKENDRQTD